MRYEQEKSMWRTGGKSDNLEFSMACLPAPTQTPPLKPKAFSPSTPNLEEG